MQTELWKIWLTLTIQVEVVKIIVDIKSSEVESSGHNYPSENSFWNFPGNWATSLLAVILW